MNAAGYEPLSPGVHAESGGRYQAEQYQVEKITFGNPTSCELDHCARCRQVALEVLGQATCQWTNCLMEDRDGGLTWGLIALTYGKNGEISCGQIPVLLLGKCDSKKGADDRSRRQQLTELLINGSFEEALRFAKEVGLGHRALLLSTTVVETHKGPFKGYTDCQLAKCLKELVRREKEMASMRHRRFYNIKTQPLHPLRTGQGDRMAKAMLPLRVLPPGVMKIQPLHPLHTGQGDMMAKAILPLRILPPGVSRLNMKTQPIRPPRTGQGNMIAQAILPLRAQAYSYSSYLCWCLVEERGAGLTWGLIAITHDSAFQHWGRVPIGGRLEFKWGRLKCLKGPECQDSGDWRQHLAMVPVHSRNHVHWQESISRRIDILDLSALRITPSALHLLGMNRLSQDARASLSPAAEEGLQLVFSAHAEQKALRLVAEKLTRDMEELQASQRARRQAWKKEKSDLLQAIDDARHQKFLKMSDDFIKCQTDLNAAIEELQKAKEDHEAMEEEEEKEEEKEEDEEEEKEKKEESKHILSQPEVPAAAEQKLVTVEETGQAITDTQENLSHDERDTDTSGLLLAAAANGQSLLKYMKDQKRMEAKNVTAEEASIPEGHVLQEQPQDSVPCPTDVDLQLQMEMEFIRLEKQSLFDKITKRFMKKKEGLAAEFAKKQEEILAAHIKERSKLEEKMRKKMEKINKAELKEQNKREAKIRKEAKKAAAAEEGRQSRFCICFCF